MLQRMDDPEFWQSVTGTMERDESPIQTAYREIAEELGIILNPFDCMIRDCRRVNQYEIRQQWRHRYPQGTKYNTEYVFSLCIEEAMDIRLTEHLQCQWLPKSAAIKRAWSESNRLCIDQFVPVVI